MKKSDLSADRQKLLVPVVTKTGAALALVPPPAPRAPDLIGLQGIAEKVAEARRQLDLLQVITANLPNADLITRTVDRREAVRSSQIEGTHSGLDDLFEYEATGSEEGHPPDVRITKNYVYALKYGLERVRAEGVKAFTCDLIRGIHGRLVEGIEDHKGERGEFRTIQNWIGGSAREISTAKFVPPPADRLDPCLADLIDFLQYSAAEEDHFEFSVVLRMAVAHAQFETIHPFVDGNGRVGRILLPLMLAAEGLPPVYLAGYLKENQRDYYDYLAAVQLKGKWVDWIRFLADGVVMAVQEAATTAKGLNDILAKWEAMVKELGYRRHSVYYKFPRLMLGTPVLTADLAAKALGVSFSSASSALTEFEKLGVLMMKKKQKRNRCFYAKEVIDLLNQPPPR